jgi:hypothetical protein
VAKGTTRWFADGDEAIVVVEPQRSSYGPQWYINVGIYLRSLGDKERPQASSCHI